MLLISWYELEEVTAANSNAAVPGHVCSAILGEKSSGEAASSAMTRFKYGGCDETSSIKQHPHLISSS